MLALAAASGRQRPPTHRTPLLPPPGTAGADGGRTARARTRMISALQAALVKAGGRYTWPAAGELPAAAVAAGAPDAPLDPGVKLA